ncbi:Gfo/Idh/MocA family protein [Parapedobacter pyrenivorans]|nr:Gfo/Idh/MocA family oxidoreductase [Parapedobacter pyrenivorans]
MVKIGIIGMSEGNAHPYSWSSIVNGQFDSSEICKAGYPAVANYLEINRDTLGIDGATVSHVWCQEKAISLSIARSAGIPHVVKDIEDLLEKVDAVILARDDPEFHVEMAKPFVKAGIPLFIDKPLAVSHDDYEWFAHQVEAGKFIMSCSSMRYAPECRTIKAELPQLGDIKLVTVVGKKDWTKYGVHMVEALFTILDDPEPESVQYVGEPDRDVVLVKFRSGIVASVHLFKDIAPTFQLTFFGKSDWRIVDIRNSYAMFRDTISEFVRSVNQGSPRIPFNKTAQIIRVVIGALESKAQCGIKINL